MNTPTQEPHWNQPTTLPTILSLIYQKHPPTTLTQHYKITPLYTIDNIARYRINFYKDHNKQHQSTSFRITARVLPEGPTLIHLTKDRDYKNNSI